MPVTYPTLDPGSFYHIYNRGINSCSIFTEQTNYEHFINLMDKHIHPFVHTFAWVLMGNHFHFLVKIKSEKEIREAERKNNGKIMGLDKRCSQQFSNLFNAYTKAFNKKYKRTGSLFETKFRRILIGSEDQLVNTINYIHNNPVKHGFVSDSLDYPWSSFLTYMNMSSKLLMDTIVSEWYDEREFNDKGFDDETYNDIEKTVK